MKVSEMTGRHLDYWVAKACDYEVRVETEAQCVLAREAVFARPPGKGERLFEPSEDWLEAGPLMEGHRLSPYTLADGRWAIAGPDWFVSGESAPEVICRALVRARFGDEVEEEKVEK